MTREQYNFYSHLFIEIWDVIAEKEGFTSKSSPYEYITYDIEPVEYGDDFIDAVLVFGDGTIEFHLQNELDAYHWLKHPTEVIDSVLNQMFWNN